MTLGRLCVHPSVRLSIHPKSCLHSSFLHLLSDLFEFCRFFSYDMKVCMCFFIVVLAIFDGVMALATSNRVPATPATSLIEWILNFAECLAMI